MAILYVATGWERTSCVSDYDIMVVNELVGYSSLDKTYWGFETKRVPMGEYITHESSAEGGNTVKITRKLRARERSHPAKVIQFPYFSVCVQLETEQAAREFVASFQGAVNLSVLNQLAGQGWLVLGGRQDILIEELWVIVHDIQDGTMPYYYDHQKHQTWGDGDIFFSDYKQAKDFALYNVYDSYSIRKVYVSVERDCRYIP